jgi:hypothetical protein
VKTKLVLSLVLAFVAMTASQAMAGIITVNFIESGNLVNAYVDGVLTNSGVEKATVTIPGSLAVAMKWYVTLLDADNSVSDILLIDFKANNTTILTFASDDQVALLDITGALFVASWPETGDLQFLMQWTESGGATTVFVNGQSIETPEPSLILLLGMGLGGVSLGAWRFRR